MTRNLFVIIFICFSTNLDAQVKILHYTETSGFDHNTRSASLNMFVQIGSQLGFTVDDDNTGINFNDLATLEQYDAVIFSNTTGDNILDPVQKNNFETYINNGGSLIGIHSATDTYRHSSANGSNTGAWDWFAEILGGSVQQNPNHVAGTPVYRIDATASHALLNGVPNPWMKPEEYYYWEAGYLNPANNVIQKVEQTVGPNMLVNSYDSSRAVTWYRDLQNGGKVFYTSLGHLPDNFTSDISFYRLISNAILWSTDSTTNIEENNIRFSIYPNPVSDLINLNIANQYKISEINIYSFSGVKIKSIQCDIVHDSIEIEELQPGFYFMGIRIDDRIGYSAFIKY
jgi:type 1 glutamine amidotransferase